MNGRFFQDKKSYFKTKEYINFMETDPGNYSKYLLPYYFRVIGLVVIIISIMILVFAAIIKFYLVILPGSHLVLIYNRISFVGGLGLLVFSREKKENESTLKTRYSALFISLAVSIILLVVLEIFNINNNNAQLDAIDFLIIEMCVYYILFRLKK